MFINRPLINGRSPNKQRTSKSNSLVIQTKNKLRIKTLPSSVHHTNNKYGQGKEMNISDANLVGLKDIKDMMEGDVENMMRRLERLQQDTHSDEKLLKKGLSKAQTRKSTINGSLSVELKDNKQAYLQEQEQKAYRECVQLLVHQKKQEQKVQQKLSQQISRKFYELQQTRIQLLQLRRVAIEQFQQVKSQLNRVEQNMKIVQKRTHNRQRLLQEIALQRQKIKQMNDKILGSKQQSMKQKNKFVQIQAQEIRLIKEIEAEDEYDMKQTQKWEQFEYYKKIQKLKSKLIRQKAKESRQIDEYFKQKIGLIVKVRVSQDELDVKINELSDSIEEQYAVIQMLDKKSSTKQIINQNKRQSAQLRYINDYSKIFNSAAGSHKQRRTQGQANNTQQSENDFREIDHWQNYKFYLEKILKNEKKLQSLKQPNVDKDGDEYSSRTNNNNNNRYDDDDQESYDEDYEEKERLQKKKRNSNSNKDVYMKDLQQDDRLKRQKEMMKKKGSQIVMRKKQGQGRNIMILEQSPTRTKNKKEGVVVDRNINYHSNKANNNNQLSPNKSFQSVVLDKTSNINPNSITKQKSQHITKKTILPRLVKMQGSLQDKQKIKGQLTRFTKQQLSEQIQLQTVRTSQCDDGDVIEVEFKGKKIQKGTKGK